MISFCIERGRQSAVVIHCCHTQHLTRVWSSILRPEKSCEWHNGFHIALVKNILSWSCAFEGCFDSQAFQAAATKLKGFPKASRSLKPTFSDEAGFLELDFFVFSFPWRRGCSFDEITGRMKRKKVCSNTENGEVLHKILPKHAHFTRQAIFGTGKKLIAIVVLAALRMKKKTNKETFVPSTALNISSNAGNSSSAVDDTDDISSWSSTCSLKNQNAGSFWHTRTHIHVFVR